MVAKLVIVMVLLPLATPLGKAWSALMPEDDYGPVDKSIFDELELFLTSLGINALKDFPLAFPSDSDRRASELDGLSGEICDAVKIDRAVVRMFLIRAYD